MILNHQYRFIFIKTRKTAGSSIGYDDVRSENLAAIMRPSSAAAWPNSPQEKFSGKEWLLDHHELLSMKKRDASTGKGTDHCRDCYLSERWYAKLVADDTAFIKSHQVPGIMKALGYSCVATSTGTS